MTRHRWRRRCGRLRARARPGWRLDWPSSPGRCAQSSSRVARRSPPAGPPRRRDRRTVGVATTGQVLLVDDVPGERANFEQAFGTRLTVAPSIDILNDQLRRGIAWDVAFVDFNLSSKTSTGLTALLRLHHERPGTKIVTYSQFTESGRTLYAAAARHWFSAAALLDKVKNDPTTLVRYRESILAGINPTPVMWQRRLHWAPLID